MIAGVFEARGFYDVLAACASTIAIWASARAHRDPVAELTLRVRHPLRYALTHPVRYLRTKLR